MKWCFVFLLSFFLMTGCNPIPISMPEIDWVDFIKIDGKEYDGIYTGVISDKKYIDKKIGEVKFQVADHVSDPEYRIKDGDAAFHEKGTELYGVKGKSNLIAVKDPDEINGYRVYYSREETDLNWHFKDMDRDKVNKIEIYEHGDLNSNNLKIVIANREEMKKFLDLLINSEEDPSFQPDTAIRDPIHYEMVFYTNEPVAYKYNLQFDGKTYYWSPWDTNLLSDEIESFLLKTN